jgi:hypothetical protein
MKTEWFIAPYKWRNTGPRTFRYCAMDDFTPDIYSDDGDWTEAEIDGDKAIVIVRASPATLTRIGKGSDVAITPIEDPKPYWKPTRISSINGEEYENRTLEDINAYFFDDQKWGNFKALAESIAKQYDTKQSYIRIAKGEWRVTSQLLVLLSKAGYTLDKISTGTFPTVATVLDNFDRGAQADVGAGWTLLYDWGGTSNWATSAGNELYNDTAAGWTARYYNASTYGPDTEAYITWVTAPPTDYTDSVDIFLRAQTPGTNFDAYSLSKNTSAPNNYWTVNEYTDHVATAIGAAVTQAIANGEKVGAEIITRTITGYLYTGGAWSTILSRTDAGAPYYDSAGYIGMYLPGTYDTPRWDNLIGGTVVAAGGGLGAKRQASSTGMRRRNMQRRNGGLIIL